MRIPSQRWGNIKAFKGVIAICGLCIFLTNSHCSSQELSIKQNTGDIVFDPVIELTQSTSGPTLIGGSPADPTDWPASFYSTSDLGRCTSTLIGPRALLTAAHCVGAGAKARIRYRGGAFYEGVCQHAPQYPNDISADYALCLLDRTIPNVDYEVVNIDPDLLSPDTQISLTGYGCTQKDETGGNDEIYRIGPARITSVPAPSNQWPNYIVVTGKVILCFGDSGGGAFLLDKNSGSRKLISVNSAVEKISRVQVGDTSYLSSTSTAVAQKFLKCWSRRNFAQIKGIDVSTENCS